jgi:hypothetical protein
MTPSARPCRPACYCRAALTGIARYAAASLAPLRQVSQFVQVSKKQREMIKKEKALTALSADRPLLCTSPPLYVSLPSLLYLTLQVALRCAALSAIEVGVAVRRRLQRAGTARKRRVAAGQCSLS